MDYEVGMPTLKIKPKFLTSLDVRCVDDDNWSLINDLKYESKIMQGLIIVPAGSLTDFASIPKWLPIAYTLLKSVGKEAAVVHDWLYRKKICGKLKADRVFLEALKSKGVAVWKRNVMYWAVVAFGWKAYAD